MLFSMDTNLDSKFKLHRLSMEQRKDLFKNINNIKNSIITEDNSKPNIENLIGSAQVPLGIAGPLKVNDEEFFIPLATTEGALVASVARGCKVVNESGGATSIVLKNQQTRSILFKVNKLEDVKNLQEWVNNKFEELKQVGEVDEPFIKIVKIDFYSVGLNVWLRVCANTNDAMGMNMVTIASKKIAEHVQNNFKGDVEFISETGNMCVDKKPAAMNLINTRGKKVTASVLIPNSVVNDVLKTTSEKLIDMNYRKNLLGSAASGSLGFNAHFANIIAAMFIATGQDVAHTVDGSLGFTTVEKAKEGVNFSVTLTSLQVGTVGGGTGLPTQKEALAIMGVAGPGNPAGSNSKKLAEIVASAVLAGEISLLGALCSKELANAHIKHNR